jgi:alpha-1,2-mannosyltransferase
MEIGDRYSATVIRRIGSIPTGAIAAVAIVAWCASAFYMLHFGSSWHLDLRVYRAAGHELFAGGDPFIGVFTANKLPFTYPPFALLVLSPLELGPLGLIEGLWWVLSSASLVALLFLLLEAERGDGRNGHVELSERSFRRRSFAVAALLGAVSTLALEPVRSNMNYGQINLILMLLIVLDLTRADSKWRGVLVGLAAAVKLTPHIYLGYFLLRRSRASFVRGLLTFVVATAGTWLLLPSESARYWFHEVADPKRTGDVGGVSNQSWEGLLNRAPFHGGTLATVLWVVLSVATLACGAVLVRRLSAASHPAETILGLALVELLVSPISWTHHWSWLVIAPLAMVSLWSRHRLVAWLLVGLVVLALGAPYWWTLHGVASELASNSLVIAGAVVLVCWTLAEVRGTATLQRRPVVAPAKGVHP